MIDNYIVYLDGVQVPDNERNSLADAEITIRRKDEDDSVAYGFSGSFTFVGETYKKVYDKIVASLHGINAEIKVKIWDDCCERFIFYGKITSDSVSWCIDSCEIECDVVEDTDDVRALKCIQRKFIFDNALGFQQQQHPFVPYCAEMRPNVFQYMWLFIGHGLLMFMITIVAPLFILIETFIIPILLVVALFTGNFNQDFFGVWKKFIDAFEQLKDYLTGCGRGHPSPLARSYIQNVCDICGLKFKSSILNDSSSLYYNLLYVYAPVNKGFESYATWNEENKPLFTGEAYLNQLKQVFNAKWEVQNGVLIFERKDFFVNNDIWLDMSLGKDDPRYKSLCFQYSNKQAPAWARLEYQGDGLETCGNEANLRYNDLVDWDIPTAEWDRLHGEALYSIPFAPARFRRDGIEPDVLSNFYDFFSPFVPNIFLDAVFGLKEEDNYVMILSLGLCNVPKLLLWDTDTDYHRAGTVKKPIPGNGSEYYYNIGMWFAAPLDPAAPDHVAEAYAASGKPFEIPNLYGQEGSPTQAGYGFFYIDDPRRNYFGRRGWDFTLELIKDCDLVDNADFTKGIRMPTIYNSNQEPIELLNGMATEISFKRDTIVIKGTI